MNIFLKIIKYFRYINVDEKDNFDIYLQKIVASKTKFYYKDINVIYAKKFNSNRFNYFIFYYKNKKYEYENGILLKI